MALLHRYKKSGGFLQLLQLLETCTEAKKDSLLNTIEKEDQRWSDTLRQKILTMDIIFQWEKTLLGEIFQGIQELTLAIALHKFTEEQKEQALFTHSHGKRRNIEDLSQTKEPNAAEIHTAINKIIEETRHLSNTGHIKLKEIAPSLYIEEDIEINIENLPLEMDNSADNSIFEETDIDPSTLNFDTKPNPTSNGQNSQQQGPQLVVLKNEITKLRKENLVLKKQVNDIKIKFAQVKKIVAA